MAVSRNITDLVGAAHCMPGVSSAQLYSDTAAQICTRSLQQLFHEVKALSLYEEQTVLDIGCGTGEATEWLLDQFNIKEFIGVDVSAEFIDYAKEAYQEQGVTFLRMNAENDWPQSWNNKYTVVFSNYVGHWIKDHSKMLASISRCMKPNGDLIMQFFHSPLQTEDEMHAARKAAHECGIEQEMQSALQTIKRQTPIWKDTATYSKLMKSLGFTVKTCKIKEQHFKCQSKFERAGMTVTVSPFMLHVPKEKRLLFATKYVSNLKDPLTINHRAVIVHAVKN